MEQFQPAVQSNHVSSLNSSDTEEETSRESTQIVSVVIHGKTLKTKISVNERN